ncbi:MAG: NAD(P)H-dependent oxidoreductase [Gemmatimonadales bacterium]|nr:NAD(P)H-dependent oxidoreductase [Gemmatimonadales bacterium]
MHALVVLAHPDPGSFNAALAARAVDTLEAAGHTVELSDLHRDGFDPRGGPADFTDPPAGDFHYQTWQRHAAGTRGFEPLLQREVDRLARADFVLLQFPLWWFGVPAMLKGWIDRVFAFGFAYGPGQSHATGPFGFRKTAMLSLTTGGPEANFVPEKAGSLDTLLHAVEYGALDFAGFRVLPRFVAWSAARVGDGERAAYLDALAGRLRALDATEPLRYR